MKNDNLNLHLFYFNSMTHLILIMLSIYVLKYTSMEILILQKFDFLFIKALI